MYTHKPFLYGAVVPALAAIALAGCSKAKPAAPAAQPPEVSVVSVHRDSVPVTLDLPGRTNPYSSRKSVHASTASCSSASSRKALT